MTTTHRTNTTLASRPPKPLPDGAISYTLATNRNPRYALVCPQCGAGYNFTMTSMDNGRNVAKVRFVCGHGDEGSVKGEFVRVLKWGRGK